MKTRFKIRIRAMHVTMLMLGCGAVLSGALALAQSTSNGQQQGSASQQNKPKGQQEANPFPEDTNTVPVLPSANAPASVPDAIDSGAAAMLPSTDGDPVRSPEDTEGSSGSAESSSSNAGTDSLLGAPPDEEREGKHRRLDVPDKPHVENASEDESVGSYYLDQKNWKAALSRYESAVVLDPENPDVYWGLAEAQRHMGDYANAKVNYLKVTAYDPDSKHGKEAKKLLKDPELANAKAVSANASGATP